MTVRRGPFRESPDGAGQKPDAEKPPDDLVEVQGQEGQRRIKKGCLREIDKPAKSGRVEVFSLEPVEGGAPVCVRDGTYGEAGPKDEGASHCRKQGPNDPGDADIRRRAECKPVLRHP